MAITKVTVHGVADTAGELETVMHRIAGDLTAFIADKSALDASVWDSHVQRDKEGNLIYALTDLKLTPKLNEIVNDEMVDYVVGHATYTIWTG